MSVVWRQDRWGEETEVVAVFSEHAAAVEWAEAETARTHALAEERRELWFARLYFVSDFEVDAPDVKPDTRALAAPAVSDRVEKPEVDLSRIRGARRPN